MTRGPSFLSPFSAPGDKASIDQTECVKRVRLLFDCQTVLVAKEELRDGGYHFHVAVPFAEAARYTFRSRIRSVFREFTDPPLEITLCYSQTQLLLLCTEFDNDPFASGRAIDWDAIKGKTLRIRRKPKPVSEERKQQSAPTPQSGIRVPPLEDQVRDAGIPFADRSANTISALSPSAKQSPSSLGSERPGDSNFHSAPPSSQSLVGSVPVEVVDSADETVVEESPQFDNSVEVDAESTIMRGDDELKPMDIPLDKPKPMDVKNPEEEVRIYLDVGLECWVRASTPKGKGGRGSPVVGRGKGGLRGQGEGRRGE